ncbi:MAG: AAA family ATPase [Pseudomonadota bacterium]
MYHSFFGLKEAPFSIAVNPRYLFMSPGHRDALAHLLYGIGAGGGFILLTGEVGTGKTTINRCLLEQLPDNADLAVILNPALESVELLAAICDELGLTPPQADAGLKVYSDALHRFLLVNHERGRKTVLMIDEAQHLSFDALEQIRLLTNLETSEEKLLHIILIGQPELAVRLARPELRQLNQRITARFELSALTPEETASYIRHRLTVAGLVPGRELFPAALVRAIHRSSGGIPRRINLLCDRMLLGAYGRDSTRLDRQLLREAAREAIGEDVGGRSVRLNFVVPAVLALLVVALALGVALRAPQSADSTPVDTSGGTAMVSEEAAIPQAEGVAEVQEAEAGSPAALREPQPEAARNWFLSPAEGIAAFAGLYGISGQGAVQPCATQRPLGLECSRSQPQSWNRLLEEPRPALLELVDTRRFSGHAILIGSDAEIALLATPTGFAEVALEELASLWTGDAWHYWKRPDGITRSLALGDRGPDVAAVARLFARLDGEEQPLTEDVYSAVLEERVRLFQRAMGLDADGVLGTQTLRALAVAAGADMDRAMARERLSARLSARSARGPGL